MKYSKFGQELRKIMLDNNENLRNLAEYLEVSTAFVSSVMVGKKNVPASWIDSIIIHYNLSSKYKNTLIELAEKSKNSIKLNLQNCTANQRNLAYEFQRNLNNLSEDEIKKLNKILGKE